MTLAIYQPDTAQARAVLHAHQPEEARRAQAVRAARDSDTDGLFALMCAYQSLSGKLIPAATTRTYRAGLEAWITWTALRGVSVLRPGPRAGSLYLADAGVRGLSPATIRVRVAAIRKLYAAMRDAGINAPDPFDGVRLPTDPTPSVEKHPPYTPQQIQALLDHAPTRHDRALILLCAHAGLRIQEALNLTAADVDLDGRVARVLGKGGKLRTVPLSGPTVVALRELGVADGFLLDTRAYTTVYDRLGRIAASAGVDWRGFHAGRKHAGTELYKHVPLEHVQRVLGHASPVDTLRYVQISGDATRNAVAELWG